MMIYYLSRLFNSIHSKLKTMRSVWDNRLRSRKRQALRAYTAKKNAGRTLLDTFHKYCQYMIQEAMNEGSDNYSQRVAFYYKLMSSIFGLRKYALKLFVEEQSK